MERGASGGGGMFMGQRVPPQVHLVCYLVILLGAGYRIYHASQFNPLSQLQSDMGRHWSNGINTDQCQELYPDCAQGNPMAYMDPILFQLYVAVLAKITLSIPALVAFYTALLACSGPWIWYRFMRELLPDKTLALAGWAALSWIPSWISIYGYFMQETLMIPMLGGALWATWRSRRKKTLNSFLAAVLLWSLAGLTRGVLIPVAAVVAIWLVLEQPRKIVRAAAGLALLTLILGPLTYRGYQSVNMFAPHGIGHLNVAYAKSGCKNLVIRFTREGQGLLIESPSISDRPFYPLSTWQSPRECTLDLTVDLGEGSRPWQEALDRHALTPRLYAVIAIENLIHLFFSPSWPDSDPDRAIGVTNYWTRWLWAPLFLACATATLLSLRRQRRHLLLPAIILTWFVVQGLLPIAINEGRYRMPLYGLLVAQTLFLAGTELPGRRLAVDEVIP